MTNQEAAEIVKTAFQMWESEYGMTGEDWSEEHKACEMAMKAVSEEAIPVDWINRFLDWLEKVNNDMSLRDAKGIRVMLAQWRTGRGKFDTPEGCGSDSCNILK